MLVLGLLLAVARTLRGPVFFPLRALAVAYTDFFRGLPLIINLMIVVLGVPALRLQGVTVDPVVLGGRALVLTYSAYVAEVFRAGIESVHSSQRAAARSLGLSNRPRRCGTWYCRRPYGARCRRCSTTWCRCRRTPGSSRSAAPSTPSTRRDIIVGRDFNYTPYVVAGLVFVALTIPMTRFTDWVTATDGRQQRAGRQHRERTPDTRRRSAPVLRLEPSARPSTTTVVLRDVNLEVAAAHGARP